MSDLIDREQAKGAIDKYLVGRNLVTDGTFMARLINEIVIDRLPSAQLTFDARDTQYNLPIGTDCISRQQAIDAVKKLSLGETDATRLAMRIGDYLERLTSAQPEIIRCKDCKHYKYGICKKAGLCVNKSPNGFCDWGERREATE